MRCDEIEGVVLDDWDVTRKGNHITKAYFASPSKVGK